VAGIIPPQRACIWSRVMGADTEVLSGAAGGPIWVSCHPSPSLAGCGLHGVKQFRALPRYVCIYFIG
jgi:hypothetical protein